MCRKKQDVWMSTLINQFRVSVWLKDRCHSFILGSLSVIVAFFLLPSVSYGVLADNFGIGNAKALSWVMQ